ncbi:MAG: hypothetical protein HQ519_16645 [Planctomycetes bacterium]|nr:hypothetical protein [Planctomycetota bacterium]
MDTKASVSPRGLVLALTLAAVPSLAASYLGEDIFQQWDLLVSGAILAVALLMVIWREGRTSNALASMSLALLVLIVPTAFVHLRMDAPASNDERSYLFQAQVFSEGQLADNVQGHPMIDFAIRQRQVHDFRDVKRRFSKYSPATAIALTPGVWLGWPPLMVLLAGIADLIFVSLIARRMGLNKPRMAALVLATSPFFLLVQSSFQSEVFTLPAALAGYLALLKSRQNPKAGPTFSAFLVGLCAGWIFLGRPLTGVVFAAAMALGLWFGPAAPRWRGVFSAILGGLPMLFLALAYNRVQTGEWLLSPYQSYAQHFGPWENPGADFKDRIAIDVYGNGDFLQGILRQLGRWGVAFGGMLGAVGLAWWGLWRTRQRDGGAAAVFALLLPAAYALHWYPGHWGYLGPLYCLESLGMLVVGFLLLMQDSPKAWRNNLVLAVVAWGAILFVLRLQPLQEQVDLRAIPERVAVEMADDSVLLLPYFENPTMAEPTMKYWTPTRKPAAQRVAIVRELPTLDSTKIALEALGLEGRAVFRLTPSEQGIAGTGYSFVPLELP